jgi:hypothetical protein
MCVAFLRAWKVGMKNWHLGLEGGMDFGTPTTNKIIFQSSADDYFALSQIGLWRVTGRKGKISSHPPVELFTTHSISQMVQK